MSGALFGLARPLLFALDAEDAHRLTIRALRSGLLPGAPAVDRPALATRVFGLDFHNPIGLAAGFDKNAEVPDAMLRFRFGFVEIGSVTPRPQAGNPRPRLFRLAEDEAVINRMGFNNDGHGAVLARLKERTGRAGIVGVNIGANKDSTDRIGDYALGAAAFNGVASYLVVNVSSPNTPGLRNLQGRAELTELVQRLGEARSRISELDGRSAPLLLKIAPDLGTEELQDVAEVCLQGGVDGILVSNTTISRPPLSSPCAAEAGGLSGKPLFELSTRRLAELYGMVGGRLPLVGAGGVDSAEAAWQKIRAGASLVQLYSALVYRGPGLVGEIAAGLDERLQRAGFARIGDAVGSGSGDWR